MIIKTLVSHAMTNKFTVDDYLNNKTPAISETNIPKPKTPPKSMTKFPKFGLGQAGEYLTKIYGKSKSYQAVDLSKSDFGVDAFRHQNRQLGQQLFGTKGVVAQNLVQKLISGDKLDAMATALYDRLATWAGTWAKYSLAKHQEFAKLAILSPSEKQDFVHKVATHNRMLASCGGLTGFWGLKGVVVDTAWLLLVSLKSVYEIALIYNKPLTGKDGIRFAYGILASCDLQKLQEKQVIMTALAMGETVVRTSNSHLGDDLKHELQKLRKNAQNDDQSLPIDELLNYINLDKLNGKFAHSGRHWLGYLLPIGASLVTVHYNNVLLEEVLGVAMATFKDDPLLLVDKSNQTQ